MSDWHIVIGDGIAAACAEPIIQWVRESFDCVETFDCRPAYIAIAMPTTSLACDRAVRDQVAVRTFSFAVAVVQEVVFLATPYNPWSEGVLVVTIPKA